MRVLVWIVGGYVGVGGIGFPEGVICESGIQRQSSTDVCLRYANSAGRYDVILMLS